MFLAVPLRVTIGTAALIFWMHIQVSCSRAEEGIGTPLKGSASAVELTISALKRMPAWTNARANDKRTRQQILSELEGIDVQETEVLQRAVKAYWEMEVLQKGVFNVDAASRLFVLNRYVFNVPDWVTQGTAKFFGGWAGVPIHEGRVNMAWPLSIRGEAIELDGSFDGYYGPSYEAVLEFDDFNSRFGRRRKSR